MNEEKGSCMQKILNSVRMAQSVQPANYPPKEGALAQPTAGYAIVDVRAAVGEFLQKNLDAMRVNVTKLAQIDPEQGSWEAEADIYVPNTTIRNLGLPVSKQVLDCQRYVLRLDGQLNITAYGLKDLVGG